MSCPKKTLEKTVWGPKCEEGGKRKTIARTERALYGGRAFKSMEYLCMGAAKRSVGYGHFLWGGESQKGKDAEQDKGG